MRSAEEVGKTVHTCQRVWMLMPEHLLLQRQRLSVHCLRLFVLTPSVLASPTIPILLSVSASSPPSTLHLT
jgi:hypothetical protein